MRKFLLKWFMFILGLLIVLEVTTRVFNPQQLVRYDSFYVSDDSGLGRVPAPNVDQIVNTGEGDVRLITDGRGLRIGPQPLPEAVDKRILMLGDSFMAALQVPYEQSTDALLERSLSEALGSNVIIDNRSSASFGLNHYAIALEQELQRQDYDLVLVFINPSNDLIERSTHYYPPQPFLEQHLRLPKRLTLREFTDAVLYPINNSLEQSAHLFVLMKNRAKILLAQLGLSPHYFPQALQRNFTDDPAWDTSIRRLVDMQDLAAQYQTPILFILVPIATQVDERQLAWYQEAFSINPDTIRVDQPQEKFGAASERHKLPLIDPYKDFVDAVRAGSTLYGTVDTHFSAEGHRLFADLLYRHLLSILREAASGASL